MTIMVGTMWALYWILLWWPMYLLAFFPQLGYFPVTGVSALEMDQIATVVGVAVVVVIRTSRRIFARSPAYADPHSMHVAPLLALSGGSTN